jgi:nucleotidyltransferase substrate binding protein (TIGR01987 family)
MALELTSLRGAISALRAVIERSDDVGLMQGLDVVTQNAIKVGAIQHFEMAYELSWKFIKRWLETNVSPSTADGVTRRELFRLGAEQRLLEDVDRWMEHHHARNLTSHTYDAGTAEEVYQAAHAFVRDAESLLAALEARND